MKLGQQFPFLRTISIWRFRLLRWLRWIFGQDLAISHHTTPLPFLVASHESVLLRKLGNSDQRLQQNKIINLKLATAKISGILIKPGETFSFWRTVGWASKKKGFVTGMLLSNGKVTEGIGGGLCQSANLLYWMALHSPLVVTERHRHSYDIFPDSGRVLPFGTGAAVYYNYVDLQFFNPTKLTFQILIGVDATHLHGEIRSSALTPISYKIHEVDHRFTRSKKTGQIFRENAIYRKSFNKRTGQLISNKLLYKNHCETLYTSVVGTPIVEVR
jgi:vancomycin resistance protein VanW